MSKLQFVLEKNPTVVQKQAIKNLQKECFGDVDIQSIEDDFIAKEFGRIFAYKENEIIGMLGLFKRNITFAGKKITIGGTGGVCVTAKARRKGIATQMIKRGLEVLKKEKCDIACLNADLKKKAYKLYEKVGFKFMKRKISFENIKGEIKYDTGTMFIPICSKGVCDLIMKSKSIFHYGRGYW
ncbi:MAG TPA: GNAT family N-acetyltransferase [Candidatus Bathyarchaeia archaeon]|nr:GNAT family N-acetyltransferase [Candidatus Bathyarchaeia archaeon]